MKEHAKKALKHDFKVAGKTVPTLALVALFLVGTGSAALLTSFGTVEGTAEVDQSIVFGQDGEAEGITALANFNTTDEESLVAGASLVDTAYLVNNYEEEVTVSFNSTQEFTNTTGDDSTTSGNVDGLRTGFLAFNGLSDTLTTTTESGDDASVSYVVDEADDVNRSAVLLNVDKESSSEGSAAYAGIKFNVSESFTGSNTVSINYRAGDDHVVNEGEDSEAQKAAPDWILYNVTATTDIDVDDDSENEYKEGESYIVGDVSVEGNDGQFSGTGPDFDGDNSNVVAWPADNKYSFISSPDSLVGNAEIDEIKLSTGTSGDPDDSELYIYDVTFNDNSLLKSIPHMVTGSDGGVVDYEVPSGNHTVKIVNELDIAAYPGEYTVTAEALP